jgi:lysine 2,3-aminomutase
MMATTHYLTDISVVRELTPRQAAELTPVTDVFPFRSNTYFQSLIDWNDPADPIKRIILPNVSELSGWGFIDASNEAMYTAAPGLEHKYRSTALLLVTDVCGGYCRFCFRKRLFMAGNDEVARDVTPGIAYITQHPEVSNVLLTGGDPLMLSTRRLDGILRQLAAIPHVRIIRIGSKMPAFQPTRVTGDPALAEMIRDIAAQKAVYVMAHFNHPREVTVEALAAVSCLRAAGATVVNQTPIIRGVNDSAAVLSALFDTLSYHGVAPYYVFQCRPTLGNEMYSVPLEEAYGVFAGALTRGSGLARRARFVMSHVTGKIECVGQANGAIYLRYHEAVSAADANRLLIFKSNPAAHWLDDYREMQAIASELSEARA